MQGRDMKYILQIITLFFIVPAQAEDIALTIEEIDNTRNRLSLLVLDASQVPLQTVIRVHSKTGSCEVTIVEKVNDHLVASTNGCAPGVLKPGMKLAYSSPNSWEQPTRNVASDNSRVSTQYNAPDLISEILDRTTVFIGHNFAGELEGNVYADGSLKNLDGDTAFSLGVKGRVYDFTDRLSLAVELGYETPRTLDQATFVNGNAQTVAGTIGFSPRLSLWSLAVQGEAKVMERMTGFLGFNVSLPSLSNSPFAISSGLGFQGGANYQILPQIAVEGLIKITNMNLENQFGQTTDVSLAGLELRGRYSF
jgi:hypothetical protein